MNQFQFLGFTSKDTEIRYMKDEKIITNLFIAVRREYKKEGEPNADFFKITAFGKLAEFVSKYIKEKGQQICIIGHIQNGSYDDLDGKKIYTTEYIADKIYFAGGNSKKENVTQQENFADELPF